MQESTEDTTATWHQALVDQYDALRLELTILSAQPIPNPAAIDAAMKKIDAVQMELKAITSRPDDPQRF